MDENEKLYVVCAACGEAFDDLDAAKNHEDYNDCDKAYYQALPESKAF